MEHEEELRGEKRRNPPLGVRLEAALRQIVELWRKMGIVPADLPFEEVRLEFDHNPALGRRDVDPETRKYIPDQHDPRFLEYLYKPLHDIKTRGSGATTRGSDVGEIAREKRRKKKARERAHASATKAAIKAGEQPPPPPPRGRSSPKRPWPKQKFPTGHRPIQSRGFAKKGKRDER